jgi:hypothetical protein
LGIAALKLTFLHRAQGLAIEIVVIGPIGEVGHAADCVDFIELGLAVCAPLQAYDAAV